MASTEDLRWLRSATHVTVLFGFVSPCATISVCGQSGEWQTAVRLLREMATFDGVTAGTREYNAAIAACCRCRQWEHAAELVDEMQSRAITRTEASWTPIIAAARRAGEQGAAVGLAARARLDGKAGRDDAPAAGAAAVGTVGVKHHFRESALRCCTSLRKRYVWLIHCRAPRRERPQRRREGRGRAERRGSPPRRSRQSQPACAGARGTRQAVSPARPSCDCDVRARESRGPRCSALRAADRCPVRARGPRPRSIELRLS